MICASGFSIVLDHVIGTDFISKKASKLFIYPCQYLRVFASSSPTTSRPDSTQAKTHYVLLIYLDCHYTRLCVSMISLISHVSWRWARENRPPPFQVALLKSPGRQRRPREVGKTYIVRSGIRNLGCNRPCAFCDILEAFIELYLRNRGPTAWWCFLRCPPRRASDYEYNWYVDLRHMQCSKVTLYCLTCSPADPRCRCFFEGFYLLACVPASSSRRTVPSCGLYWIY